MRGIPASAQIRRPSPWEAFVTPHARCAYACVPLLQELTRNTVHQIGGTAYLSLESDDEPFLHGIKYTAMPPSKRFRDMEQLSGESESPLQVAGQHLQGAGPTCVCMQLSGVCRPHSAFMPLPTCVQAFVQAANGGG
eukprot:360622-Chlamydomonas_euryale.AAC.20